MADLRAVGGDRPRGETVGCIHRGTCGATRTTRPGQSIKELLAELREVGWLVTKELIVCPRCRGRM